MNLVHSSSFLIPSSRNSINLLPLIHSQYIKSILWSSALHTVQLACGSAISQTLQRNTVCKFGELLSFSLNFHHQIKCLKRILFWLEIRLYSALPVLDLANFLRL